MTQQSLVLIQTLLSSDFCTECARRRGRVAPCSGSLPVQPMGGQSSGVWAERCLLFAALVADASCCWVDVECRRGTVCSNGVCDCERLLCFELASVDGLLSANLDVRCLPLRKV